VRRETPQPRKAVDGTTEAAITAVVIMAAVIIAEVDTTAVTVVECDIIAAKVSLVKFVTRSVLTPE